MNLSWLYTKIVIRPWGRYLFKRYYRRSTNYRTVSDFFNETLNNCMNSSNSIGGGGAACNIRHMDRKIVLTAV